MLDKENDMHAEESTEIHDGEKSVQESVHDMPVPPSFPSVSVQSRYREKNTVGVSLLISLLVHGLLAAVITLLLVHYRGPILHSQKGDGIPPGATGSGAISAEAEGPGQVLMPGASFQETASPSLRTVAQTPEEQSLDTVPPEFAALPDLVDDQTPQDLILVGLSATAVLDGGPTHHSTPPASAKPGETAGSAANSGAHSTDSTAVSGSSFGGSAGKNHVWTGIRPAGRGGAGGHGGSRDGLDSNGWPIPDYPQESSRRGEEGRVKLEMEMRADGTIGNIKVVQDAGFPRLAAAAIDAAHRVKFDPATCDGKPVTITVIVPFDFSLR